MKIRMSLPEKEQFLEFFSRYADLIPGVYRLGFFSQLISGITESSIIYAIVYSHVIDFSNLYSHIISLFTAILLSFTIEVGLRKFAPFSIRAFLNKRFQGLDLYMSIPILFITCTLLFFSGYLSFRGSKDLVELAAPPPSQQGFERIDSTLTKEITLVNKEYKRDSTQIAESYTSLVKAQEDRFNAKIQAQRAKLRSYSQKETITGKSYPSKKNQIREHITNLEVTKKDSIAAIMGRNTKELQSLRLSKNTNLTKEKDLYLVSQADIKTENRALRELTKGKTHKYGNFLAWFTIACLAFFMLSITLKEIHDKGSGIKQIAIPDQFYFEQNIWTEFIQAIVEKIQYRSRSWIRKWAEKTPEPPLPRHLPTLYDYSKIQQEIIHVTKEFLQSPGAIIKDTKLNGNTKEPSHFPKEKQKPQKEGLNNQEDETLIKYDPLIDPSQEFTNYPNKFPLVNGDPSLFRHGTNTPSPQSEKEIETIIKDISKTVEHYSASQDKTLHYTMTDVKGFINKYLDRKTKAKTNYGLKPTPENLQVLKNQEKWLNYWLSKKVELEEKMEPDQ